MNRNSWRARLLAALLLTVWWGAVASANGTGSASKKQPVMLTAREVGYDEPSSTATAIGNVEVVQGETILLADEVTYNQDTDVVHAVGHVSILQPTGDVFFSDDAILTDQLEKGIVEQFRARLKDNSLFAAKEGRKISKNVTVMKDAIYSPCKVCEAQAGEDSKAPFWQVEASQVVVNEDTQRVSYQNAFMDLYGVPIGYTPYFSHATPDAPSQSGLLDPQYFHATDLGSVVKQPVYLSIAPDMDATLTPWYLSGEKPLIEGEFRQRFQDGFYVIRGAITDTYNRDSEGNIAPGDEVRGYIDAHGRYQLSEHWDAGVDAERATDDTFLALYRFGSPTILTSRIFAERIEDRDYAVIESLAFQGLETYDLSSQSPYILPSASVHMESDPMAWHSRFQFDSSALVLERQEGDSDQRVSSSVGWKLPYITANGQVIETSLSLRGDAYNVSDQTTNTVTEESFSGNTGRLIPEADVDWRYPLINRFGDGHSLMLAPVVELAASPNLHMYNTIPNEDSQIAELSDVNLFSPDRYTGLDAVESGFRGTYGMRGQFQYDDRKFINWLLGQAYQQNQASPFPIATALNANYSDYIGKLAAKYNWLDVSYSFRIDRDTLQPTSNEITTNFAFKPVNFEMNYVSLRNEPLFGSRQEVFGNASLDITPNWMWTAGGRKDLGSSELTPDNPSLPISDINPLIAGAGTVGLNTGIVFHNECASITTSIGRSYVSQLDVKPSTTVSVLVVLKNFGGQNTNSASTVNASPVNDPASISGISGVSGDGNPANANVRQNSNNMNNNTGL